MTSQIVLINQAGIGIASDTLVSREEGSNRHKTFPSSNKIYELGGDHKVVVLHSGSTMIGGINYGLLIREWALQQTNPLPALADYPRQFENWLSNYRKLSIWPFFKKFDPRTSGEYQSSRIRRRYLAAGDSAGISGGN